MTATLHAIRREILTKILCVPDTLENAKKPLVFKDMTTHLHTIKEPMNPDLPTPPEQIRPSVASSDLVRRLVENHPQLSPRERFHIKLALNAGAAYGYGNVISWLMTEWAVTLRDKSGLDEKTAIMATQMSPYPLPQKN